MTYFLGLSIPLRLHSLLTEASEYIFYDFLLFFTVWNCQIGTFCFTSFLKQKQTRSIHCSLSVCVSLCVCVCLCVCVSTVFLWTKFQPNGCTDLEAVFAKWLLTVLVRILLKLVTLGQRSRSQWHKTHFFSYNSLLTLSSLMFDQNEIQYIRYTLGRLVLKFHKNWMDDDVIVTPFKLSPNNCPYLKFFWTYKLRTWNQYTTA